jgi:sigma-B regulation protein RsbU (phosphoserine phosphatase)
MADPIETTETMTCMEVWGGNEPVSSGVEMAGLDAWIYCKPWRGNAGGDVYYVSSCATGRINRLLVADVSGHGGRVAETAAELRTLMRQYINYIDQTKFVTSMNRQFTRASHDGLFATAIVTTFFAPTNTLTLTNAGHPAPLLYRRAERKWMPLDRQFEPRDAAVRNVPIGIIDSEYVQFEVKLDVGDLVLCFTDWLIESRDERCEFLGTERVLEVVRSLNPDDPARFIPSLLEKLEALNPKNLDSDDVTVLLFRPNGRAARTPIRERLLAPLRIARDVVCAVRQRRPAGWPELSVRNIGGALLAPLNRWRS